MKNTLRYIWMILLVISLVCAAAGCGRGEDSADSGTGEEYATDENGKTLLDENGKPVRLSYSILTMSYGNGWSFSTHAPTEEEIQRVYALIERLLAGLTWKKM
ncbi:MAG: hypothetical protein HFH87_02985 [Lachnospiraceae bacterium]|nr:hypothetical protein [Lachnospiraceae bacterium]